MKKLFRPLLVLVLGYALLTGFQIFLKVPMDGRLILAKLLLAMLAVAIIELLNRQPLAVRDVKAGHGQHGDAHFMEPEEVKRVYHEVQQGNETQPAMLVGASKSTWLVDTSDQSVLMVAPPGAGKSTSLYIPTITYNARVNLRTHDAQGIGQGASMVLVSVKDDLYTITSAELKKCGYRVLKLDLRNVFCSCHFNLLYRVNIEIDAWRNPFAWGCFFGRKNTMFVKIYNGLFDYGLKPKELMVFLFLSYCQNCLGTATVRNATIQQRCGLSENTIRSAVAGLEQKGLLVVSARQDRDGRRISNQYKLLQLSGAWGKLPVEAFNLDKRDFAVYAYLCRCSNGQRKAFPSFSHMATVLHMAIGTVQTAIKSLMAAGRLLKAAFRAGKHNLYILVETVAQALPGANPDAQKENRRAGTRRQKVEMLLASIASLISNSKILHEIGACQEVLLVFLKRVCQNLRNSNKTNLTYSTKERYFSLSRLAIRGEVRLSELPGAAAEVGIHGKVPFIQAEGFRVCSAFRTHGLPDRCARLFFSLYCLYSRCHQRR